MEYSSPKMEIVELETKDIITTSGTTSGKNENQLPFVPAL